MSDEIMQGSVVGEVLGETLPSHESVVSPADKGSKMESRNPSLVLVCEGSAHTLQYMMYHGCYPEYVVFELDRFKDVLPYLDANTDVVLLVKGLTDFTMSDIYAFLKDVEDNRNEFGNFSVYTNIPLGAIAYDQILYSGDLFNGLTKVVPAHKGTGKERLPLPDKKQNKARGVIKTPLTEGLKVYGRNNKIKVRGRVVATRKQPEIDRDESKYFGATIDVDFSKPTTKEGD